jgi:sugar phosphate isomerase/epimerase
MAISRRGFLAGAAATAARAQDSPPARSGPGSSGLPRPGRARTGPILCLFSRMLPDVEYPDLGPILNGLGFDGCDLSVQPDGTVKPAQTSVDMVRAVESMSGDGLELPVITTSFLSIGEPYARNVLAVAGGSGVPFFRTGYSRFPAARLLERRNEIQALAAYGRAARMGMGVPYPAAQSLIGDLDPQWVGWDFDTALAVDASLAAALPRLRMLVLRDIRRDKEQLTPCPLGEGIVDWAAIFTGLAKARFSGPLTLVVEYRAEDRLSAIRKDLAFARKMLNDAYEKELRSTSPRPSTDSRGAKSPA